MIYLQLYNISAMYKIFIIKINDNNNLMFKLIFISTENIYNTYDIGMLIIYCLVKKHN